MYGIRGNALGWIRTFLGNRTQSVVLDGEESDSIPVTQAMCWVDSVPYLHKRLARSCYFQTPTASSRHCRFTTAGSKDGRVLQIDLDSLSVWEAKYDTEFNISECQVVRLAENSLRCQIR